MRALIMTDEVCARIAAAVKRATANPVLIQTVLAGALEKFPGEKAELRLADRKPGFERPPSEHLTIPMGYRCAFSIEQQPSGLCRHLSVSVESAPGMLPNMLAVGRIAEEFGFQMGADRLIWSEEFDPGCYAINVCELIGPAIEGHA